MRNTNFHREKSIFYIKLSIYCNLVALLFFVIFYYYFKLKINEENWNYQRG